MHGTLLSINERLVRREERAGPAQSAFAAQVRAAHECMLLARRHPEVWPGTVIVAFFVCALSVSGAIFLILELDRSFEGLL
jgi:hypothetical protein